MPMTLRSAGVPLDQAIAQVLTRDDWRAVGELARIRIVQRTRAGVPPDGVDWPAYSEGYAQRKMADLGSTVVDLTASGEMLNNLRVVETTDKSVTLGWGR